MNSEEQQQRIMGYFIEEAREHLQTIEQGVLNLQEILDDPESINEVFRAAHSIKGGSAMLGVGSIQHISHRLEDFFKILKENPQIKVDERLKSLLLAGFDPLTELLDELQVGFKISDDLTHETNTRVKPIFAELESYLNQLLAEGNEQVAIAASQQKLEVAQKPSEITATESLEVIFQREVTTKMRDMLQLFRGEDSAASRSQLQDICNYFQKVGNDFGLTNWTNLAVQSKNAIVQPANSYRTLAPIIIRELKEAQDLVLANREAEIAISSQLQNLLPYRFGSDEDDEVSTIFTTAPNIAPNIASNIAPDIKAIQPESQLPQLTDANTSVDLMLDELDGDTNGDTNADDIPLFADIDADNESFDLGAIDDSAIETMDWMDGDYEISEEQTIDGPKIGATELKSLAILFENDDIDFDSAWEDIESNESNLANQGTNFSSSATDDFADLLSGDSTFNDSGNFHNSEESSEINDPLFGDFSREDEDLSAKHATATQDLFPEDTEISWKGKDVEDSKSDSQELSDMTLIQDVDLGIDIIDQLEQSAHSETLHGLSDNAFDADISNDFLDELDERSPISPAFSEEGSEGISEELDFGDDASFENAFATSDLDDPFAIDESLDADLLNDFGGDRSEAIALGTEPSIPSALIQDSDDFDTTDTNSLSIFDELGFDDDQTSGNQSNIAESIIESTNAWDNGDLASDLASEFGDGFGDEFGTDSISISAIDSIPTPSNASDSLGELEDFFAGEEEVIETVQTKLTDLSDDDDFASVSEDVSWDDFSNDLNDLNELNNLNNLDSLESFDGLENLTDNITSTARDEVNEINEISDIENGEGFGDFAEEFGEGLDSISASIGASIGASTATVTAAEPDRDDQFLDFEDGLSPSNAPETSQSDRDLLELVNIFADADNDESTLVESDLETQQELDQDVDSDVASDDFGDFGDLDSLDDGHDLANNDFENDFTGDVNGGDLDDFLNQGQGNDPDLAVSSDFEQFGDFDELIGNDDERSLTSETTSETASETASELNDFLSLGDEQEDNLAIEQSIDQSIAIDDEFASEFAHLAADLGSNSDADFDSNTTTSTTIDNLVDFFQDDDSEMSILESSSNNNASFSDLDNDLDLDQQLSQSFQPESNGIPSEFSSDLSSEFDDLNGFALEEQNHSNTGHTSQQLTSMPTAPQEITGIDDNFDFDDLEAMLGDTGSELLDSPSFGNTGDISGQNDDQTFIQFPADDAHSAMPSNDADFDDLEALLGDTGGNDLAAIAPDPQIETLPSSTSSQDDFGDLEDMLQSAFAKDVGPIKTKQTNRPAVNPRKQRIADSTMRVDVKYLDSLNNLVGELVVNRNLLEQEQERLQQFITNLLHQVQLLSDVSQRMRDQYDRSLLEASLTAGRGGRSSSMFESAAYGGNEDANGNAVTSDFEGIEFDRYNTFHVLSQEIIELIVRVRESASDIEFVVGETDQVTRQLGTITTQIQDDLKQSRMVPFAQIADRLPRGIRDRALKTGKQAELEIYGRETLIDKAILESLTDPLTHLVNNAIDHGLEDPATRQAAGKSPMGKLTVRAYHQGNQTVISISDDGAGISVDKVKKSAVAKRVRTQSEVDRLNDNEVYALLFEPGFSTAAQADEFKGRGVGLDVVKTCLDEIRGVIIVESSVGKGTSFTIRLPLTLSISKAMFCISDRARIAFPVDGFEDMVEVPQSQIVLNEKGQPCLPWRDTVLPFQHLSNLLAYNRHISRSNIYGKQENDELCIIILRNDTNYLALQVDQFLGESEIVIKQLEGPIPQPAGIAGATVLGDGRVMAIANVLELFDIASGRLRPSSSNITIQPVVEEDIAADPTVLIVDDSITVRELLSLTFAKVGYRVEQAKDGQDAWEKLRAGLPCDMIFCDIEMPRMDGLDLLSRLQKDARLKDIPVAMLTSRGADRHRQSAIQLGAKGYFTKPYLEEELLSASKRLLNGETLPI